jgi:hypothetical protein
VAVRPQTLGDKLDEEMQVRSESSAEAAASLGLPQDLVEEWSDDRSVPDKSHFGALQSYLHIDHRQMRSLILRSQMRLAQVRIRE